MLNISAVVASKAPDETEEESPEKQAPRLCGEQRLWLAVLNQAIVDATLSDAALAGYPANARYRLQKARLRARGYLCRRSFDLDTVCHHAGINPDNFLAYTRGIRANGWRDVAAH